MSYSSESMVETRDFTDFNTFSRPASKTTHEGDKKNEHFHALYP